LLALNRQLIDVSQVIGEAQSNIRSASSTTRN
jgi:hypothetical protein